MSAQLIDHVAMAPLYAAAATVVLVLLAELIAPPGSRTWLLALAATLVSGTAVVTVLAGRSGTKQTLCGAPWRPPGATGTMSSCSLSTGGGTALLGAAFCAVLIAVLLLSVPLVRSGAVPSGEYVFLLCASLFGALALIGARDLITLIVALEALTLPLYVLAGMRPTLAGARSAVTFLLVSVVSTAVTLLGAALLYAVTGTVYLEQLAAVFPPGHHPALRPRVLPLAAVAVALVLVGLVFKVAAVPFHAWVAGVYDGAPLPVAALLSTGSKLGGLVAVILVAVKGLAGGSAIWASVLTVLVVLSMTVGNLLALRETRMVRLLAWSSVSQFGYVLAPLAVLAAPAGGWWGAASSANEPATSAGLGAGLLGITTEPVHAALAYAGFFLLFELGAFAVVIACRGARDGGTLEDYRGLARRRPLVGAVLVLMLAGLAGLPPGLAGLFAKVVVIRSLIGGDLVWLALVVAANTVLALAYYVRVGTLLFAGPVTGHSPAERSTADLPPAERPPAVLTSADLPPAELPSTELPSTELPPAELPSTVDLATAGFDQAARPVIVVLAVVTALTVLLGFLPQLMLRAAELAFP